MGWTAVTWLNSVSSLWAAALWRGCWEGALFVGVVWCVCRIAPRMPARIRYALWWLACAKMLLGAVVAPAVPLPVLPAHRVSATQPALALMLRHPAFRLHRLTTPRIRFTIPTTHTGFTPIVPAPDTLADAAVPGNTVMPLSLASVACLVWACGAFCILALGLGRAVRLTIELYRATAIESGPLVGEAVRVAASLGIALPRLRRTHNGRGLCVAGWCRPVILIPVDWSHPDCPLSAEERRMALAHEMAHLRRGDLWLGFMLSATACCFFFWPAAWLAVRACSVCCEEACDADALRWTAVTPQQYAAMLVKAAASGRAPLQGAMGVSPAYRQLVARMTALGQSARPISGPLRLLPAVTLAVALPALVPWRLTGRAMAAARVVATAVIQPRYTITDLGPVSGDSATFFKINENGQVLGTSDGHPFLWQDGRREPVGTLWYRWGRGGAINDSGAYTVTCYSDWGNPHAYTAQSAPRLIKGLPAYHFTVARAMNNRGWIVGSAQHSGQDFGALISHAVVATSASDAKDLGTLGGPYSAAYGVNDAGQIVGKSDVPSAAPTYPTHAFEWQDGVMRDLGTLGGDTSLAYSINNRGQIVGFAQGSGNGPRHACVWEPSGNHAIDLGVLPGDDASQAQSINDNGDIVGTSDAGPGADSNRAVLWTSGIAVDLNQAVPKSAGWRITDAMAINNRGQIVGKGMLGGVRHAFLLTPVR